MQKVLRNFRYNIINPAVLFYIYCFIEIVEIFIINHSIDPKSEVKGRKTDVRRLMSEVRKHNKGIVFRLLTSDQSFKNYNIDNHQIKLSLIGF